MKDVTGVNFQDNQWGFGQVIALFLWAPLLIQSLYYGLRELSLPNTLSNAAICLVFILTHGTFDRALPEE